MVYRKKELLTFRLVGVTGGKGHGKDTFAQQVLASGRSGASFRVKSFATPLKDMVAQVFDLPRADMDDPVAKERLLPSPIVIDNHIEALRHLTGLSISPHARVAASIRQLLQYVGTDYVRAESPDYWVDKAAESFVRGNTIVPDVRFPNEVQAVKKVGGLILKVHRIDLEDSGDTHASETSLDDSVCDVVLGVRTGDLRLPERVAHLLALGKITYLKIYDYRNVQKALQAYQGGATLKACTDLLGVKNKDSAAFRFLLDYYGVPFRKPGTWMSPHKVEGGVERKQCGVCGEWKPLAEFNKNSKSWDNRHSLCRGCASEWHRRNYERHAKTLDISKLFRSVQAQARLRGKPFELTFGEFEALWAAQKGRCFYTNKPLTLTLKDPFKASVDRLDSSKGYVVGNVVFCSAQVNLMKRNMSRQEFGDMVRLLGAHVTSWM